MVLFFTTSYLADFSKNQIDLFQIDSVNSKNINFSCNNHLINLKHVSLQK